MDLQTVIRQLEQANVTDTWGTKKEIKALPSILSDDEVIQYATSGFYDGNTVLIVLTQKRLLFVDKGMIFGIKSTEIPLDMVNGVSYSKGLLMGTIVVVNGSTKVEIKNIQKDTCPVMTEKIKTVAEQYKQKLFQPNAVSTTSDADEILKLKELLDAGILTEEEFTAKKRQILGI